MIWWREAYCFIIDISGIKVHRYTGVKVYRCKGIQVYRYTGVQVYRYTGIQVYRYTGIPGSSLTNKKLMLNELKTA